MVPGPGAHVEAEIASQPEAWVAAGELAERFADRLPPPGARVLAIGCGTGHNIAKMYAALREGAGQGETDAVIASEASFRRSYDHVLAISRSGTTTEVLEALSRVPPGVGRIAVLARPRSALAGLVDEVVPLDFADESSVVQTRFATSAVVLIRVHLGEDLDALVEASRAALVAPLPGGALERRQYSFLGRGWTIGLADEAALKLRESAQVWVESYPAYEYRHGPISVADPSSLVWCFGEPPPDLAAEVESTGASFVASKVDPLADLIRAQRLAVLLARARGLDPDRPRHLFDSVVLGSN